LKEVAIGTETEEINNSIEQRPSSEASSRSSYEEIEEWRLLGCYTVWLTRATQCNIPEDTILHSHRHENLKSYL
jgi:hypothetical protein